MFVPMSQVFVRVWAAVLFWGAAVGCRERSRFSESGGAAAPAAIQDQKKQGAAQEGESSVSLVSFNGKHIGRKNQDRAAVARLLALADPDVVALQEVNTGESGTQAVKELATLLGELTGQTLCVGLSGVPSDARERYALLWKESLLSYVTTAGEMMERCPSLHPVTLPLFTQKASEIVREPAFGLFLVKATKAKFVAATVHLVPSGKKPQDEVTPVFESLPQGGEALARLPLVIMGDFNLSARHPAFQIAKDAGFQAVMKPGTKTSLKMKKRAYNAEYDHFFARGLDCTPGVIIDVYQVLKGKSANEIYDEISDHAPIQTRCKTGNRAPLQQSRGDDGKSF